MPALNSRGPGVKLQYLGICYKLSTVRTGVIEPHARTLELLLPVRSGTFFSFFRLKLGLRGSFFAARSPHYPRERIPDVLARDSTIPVSGVNYFQLASGPGAYSSLLVPVSWFACGHWLSFDYLECSLLPHYAIGICRYTLCGTSDAVTIVKGIAINYTQKFARASGFKCCAVT